MPQAIGGAWLFCAFYVPLEGGSDRECHLDCNPRAPDADDREVSAVRFRAV